MSTIVIGVDASERSQDAIAFGVTLAGVTDADVVVAAAYPYADVPARVANASSAHCPVIVIPRGVEAPLAAAA